MDTYKLIKKYPSLPYDWEVGVIVGLGDCPSLGYAPTNGKYHQKYLQNAEVENNPDYWGKVTEIPVGTKVVDTNPGTEGNIYEKLSNGKWKIGSQDYFTISESSVGENKRFRIVEKSKPSYEILSIIDKVTKETKKVKDFDLTTNTVFIFNNTLNKFHQIKDNIDFMFRHCNIYSVQRISDKEVFTIGDTVASTKSPTLFKGKIFRFEIVENTIRVHFDGYDNIESISKVKSPLFVTEDKVEIYEGNSCVEVNSKFQIHQCTEWRNHYGNNGVPLKGKIMFSSKEKAEEYVILNKPCLSINDILSFSFSESLDEDKFRQKLKELVKNKIKDV